jgi:serine protease
MKNLIFIAVFLCISQILTAQTQDIGRAWGQVLVQLAPEATIDHPIEICAQLSWEKTLAADWRIQLYSFDENAISTAEVLRLLQKSSGVEAAQLNARTYDRVQPNDAEWFRQGDMTLIKAPAAWDLTTGGNTAQGDTIVVAVLEKGYYREHPDYQSNRWYNHAEIPDNGIDDDQNGYLDDFRGYDPRNQGDGHGTQSNHGTGVTGIVGAKGNNSTGISGVNWTVKVMNLTHVDYESEIIDAYYYVHKARKLYNSTNGQRGAFVVATNASFGIDREKAEDHKLWCAVYDSLGASGVLSIGATTNNNTNVDVEGDMPTSCTSPYLITVTNVNQQDAKQAAGFGEISIDLAAPGTGTVTTGYLNGTATYSVLGGTSSAAPHVTGAVALIYSLPCAEMTVGAKTKPNEAAVRVRDLIVNNLDDNLTLVNITKYGGRLNLFKPLEQAQKLYCSGGFGELDLEMAFTNTRNELTINGTLTDNTLHWLTVYNTLGQLIYEKQIKQTSGVFNEVIDVMCWPAGAYTSTVWKGKEKKSLKFLIF